jgi:hypothetical protein
MNAAGCGIGSMPAKERICRNVGSSGAVSLPRTIPPKYLSDGTENLTRFSQPPVRGAGRVLFVRDELTLQLPSAVSMPSMFQIPPSNDTRKVLETKS